MLFYHLNNFAANLIILFLINHDFAIFVANYKKKVLAKLRKKIFLELFGVIVVILALIRFFNPSLAQNPKVEEEVALQQASAETDTMADSILNQSTHQTQVLGGKKGLQYMDYKMPRFKDARGNALKNRIYSVSSYRECFSDLQDIQILAAQKWGVSPVKDRAEAERRKNELVFVGSNPYYTMDKRMARSIPYLIPRASDLLQRISRSFLDSLAIKGIPLHTLIVTSVLRTEDDVRILRQYNSNASEQSCHRFGTTFDISYSRYKTVRHPDGPERRAVRNDSLKWVLSEVLRDVREQGLCYVKHEVKQGCFHITVR